MPEVVKCFSLKVVFTQPDKQVTQMQYTPMAVGHLFVTFRLAYGALSRTHRFDDDIGSTLADAVINTYVERGLLNLPLTDEDIEHLAIDSLQRFLRANSYRSTMQEIALPRHRSCETLWLGAEKPGPT